MFLPDMYVEERHGDETGAGGKRNILTEERKTTTTGAYDEEEPRQFTRHNDLAKR